MIQTNEVLIDVQDLHKVFVTEEVETHALSGIHLKIHKGEYIAIAGPSGCGKSTLLSVLGLLDSPTEGDYNLNNNPVADLSIHKGHAFATVKSDLFSRASTLSVI